jgi:hypothetical protein
VGGEQSLGDLGALEELGTGPDDLGALLSDRGTALGGRGEPFDARGKPLWDRGRPLEDRGKDKRTAERQASVSKALMYSCRARRMVCSRVWPRYARVLAVFGLM